MRAFEHELGVQVSVDFWDPASFFADGSIENSAHSRRQPEIKRDLEEYASNYGYAIFKEPAAGWGQ
eukprot:9755636-Heterocapsa_arctica.AAC.1